MYKSEHIVRTMHNNGTLQLFRFRQTLNKGQLKEGFVISKGTHVLSGMIL